MNHRKPHNISQSPLCANCEKRVWYRNEYRKAERRYFAPKWFRDLFIEVLGEYPLGTYRIVRCEVCGKTMAVFDENKGQFLDEVLVLYACSLLSIPLPPENDMTCDNQKSCYGCSLKKGEWYVRRQ